MSRESCDQYKLLVDGSIIDVPCGMQIPENAVLWNGYDYANQRWVENGLTAPSLRLPDLSPELS